MATPTRPRVPADASDDLLQKLYAESRDGVPADRRATCPVHLDWRDRCHSWH
ncbi:hypothetical protein [Streptomyces sp. NPDC020747]|uniref:hypothetical protein n=1 Tax=Streptomyces sp. NPDC020747 TaxID=3365086 RepID=UPI0037BD8B1B